MRLRIHYRPFNGGGKGGQHSNKTLNAMECSVTLPDGRVLKASSSRHKSQHRNRQVAERVLLSRVRAALQPERRRPDLGERVRTYHAGRNDVVDHATGEHRTWDEVWDGHGFDELVEARREELALREATR